MPAMYLATWKIWKAFLLKDDEMVDFKEWHNSWKITLEPITGNFVISEVRAVMYVVLSKAEKGVSYGKLDSTTECVAL
jgi:hypothetical protein